MTNPVISALILLFLAVVLAVTADGYNGQWLLALLFVIAAFILLSPTIRNRK